jgi:hypothetical protein
MGWSHQQHFVNVLAKQPGHRSSWPQLTSLLSPKFTPEQVRLLAHKFDADPKVPISVVIGGVQYYGTEIGRAPGLYRTIAAGIQRSWARREALGPSATVHYTAWPSVLDEGDWRNPDIVVEMHRRAPATERVHFHAVEIEQPGGFDIKSVYQAYEQARGAHFAWVFVTGVMPNERRWGRIRIAARDLGIGIVHAKRISAPMTWSTQTRPRALNPGTAATRRFLDGTRIDPTHWMAVADVARPPIDVAHQHEQLAM